jgi:hypothetical protein
VGAEDALTHLADRFDLDDDHTPSSKAYSSTTPPASPPSSTPARPAPRQRSLPCSRGSPRWPTPRSRLLRHVSSLPRAPWLRHEAGASRTGTA